MPPAQRRQLLANILLLLADLDEEPLGTVLGARQAALLVSQDRDQEAIAAMRAAKSGTIAAVAFLIESYMD